MYIVYASPGIEGSSLYIRKIEEQVFYLYRFDPVPAPGSVRAEEHWPVSRIVR